jgi:hypothetical protein
MCPSRWTLGGEGTGPKRTERFAKCAWSAIDLMGIYLILTA